MDLNKARDDGALRCSGISWTICKQSAPRFRQPHRHLITQFFTERMLFLMHNQQCQSTESKSIEGSTAASCCILMTSCTVFPYTCMCSFVYRNQRPTHPVCFLGFSFTLYLFCNLKLISISLCKLLINRSLYDTKIS